MSNTNYFLLLLFFFDKSSGYLNKSATMAPRRPPRQGKKAVSPVSRPKSPRVVLVRTETDENGEKDSATSARSRPRSRSNSVSKRGGGGRRGSGGSGKLASTSTASCYVTRNQQQSLFFPIQVCFTSNYDKHVEIGGVV